MFKNKNIMAVALSGVLMCLQSLSAVQRAGSFDTEECCNTCSDCCAYRFRSCWNKVKSCVKATFCCCCNGNNVVPVEDASSSADRIDPVAMQQGFQEQDFFGRREVSADGDMSYMPEQVRRTSLSRTRRQSFRTNLIEESARDVSVFDVEDEDGDKRQTMNADELVLAVDMISQFDAKVLRELYFRAMIPSYHFSDEVEAVLHDRGMLRLQKYRGVRIPDGNLLYRWQDCIKKIIHPNYACVGLRELGQDSVGSFTLDPSNVDYNFKLVQVVLDLGNDAKEFLKEAKCDLMVAFSLLRKYALLDIDIDGRDCMQIQRTYKLDIMQCIEHLEFTVIFLEERGFAADQGDFFIVEVLANPLSIDA